MLLEDVLVQDLCLFKLILGLVQPSQVVCGGDDNGIVVGFVLNALLSRAIKRLLEEGLEKRKATLIKGRDRIEL